MNGVVCCWLAASNDLRADPGALWRAFALTHVAPDWASSSGRPPRASAFTTGWERLLAEAHRRHSAQEVDPWQRGNPSALLAQPRAVRRRGHALLADRHRPLGGGGSPSRWW